MTSKSEKLNYGLFGAYTDEVKHRDTLGESGRGFGVLRAKYKILDASDVGMLFSGAAVNSDTYNYAIGLDGTYRSGPNQFIIQSAISDKMKKIDWAVSSGYFGFVKDFLTMGGIQLIGDSFDVSDIGYVPWIGMKKLLFLTGPFWNYPRGVLRNLWVGLGGGMVQMPGETNWAKIGFCAKIGTHINAELYCVCVILWKKCG